MSVDWIGRYFSPEQVADARSIVSEYGTETWHREAERVRRDAVIISRGSLEHLRVAIELAKTDYRDVLIGEQIDPWLRGELKRFQTEAP
jgi:hypothetical protein